MVQSEGGVLVGTAGHVDHGKTTLIRAMTGINTDRLKEERERGLTIDLGFASLKLPSGLEIGIVDVPGHERFLKNMLAGASGVDVSMLVIAADEGVMPQTREHLAILSLLQTKTGLVALTKCDMVDEEWIEMVTEDIRQFLQGTFLEKAPIIPVSGVTSEGVTELVATLDSLASKAARKRTDGPFRMPIDRVFVVKGFGTVVTGTVASGTLRVGEALSLLPTKEQTRARGIEVHGQKSEIAPAGTRAAINLAGVEHQEVSRGCVVVTPGNMSVTRCFDAYIDLLKDAARGIGTRTRVRIHTGTSEVLGRTYPIGKDSIAPGESGFVQIRSESELVVARTDSFVLRLYSPAALLGGGQILDPVATKHKRSDKSVSGRLSRALSGEPAFIVEDALSESTAGMTKEEIAKTTGITAQDTENAVSDLIEQERAFVHGKRVVHSASFEGSADSAQAILLDYHRTYPARVGMPREELRARLGSRWDQKSFQALLDILASSDKLQRIEDRVTLAGHEATLLPAQQEVAKNILKALEEAGVNPPLEADLPGASDSDLPDILAFLVQQRQVVKVGDSLYFHHLAIESAVGLLREYFEEHPEITVSEFRDLIGSSRKYAVPLLEYMDTQSITRRKKDIRTAF